MFHLFLKWPLKSKQYFRQHLQNRRVTQDVTQETGLAITGQFSHVCRMKTGKKNSKPTTAGCLSVALPKKNTWIQINTVSIPPTPPKTSRLRSTVQGANPPPPAPTSSESEQQQDRPHSSRKNTLTAPPPQTLEVEKEESAGRKMAHLIFLFLQPFSIRKSCPNLKLWFLSASSLFFSPTFSPTESSPNSLWVPHKPIPHPQLP